jgi:NADH-quinone oxidoreductase subunit K
MSHGITLYHFLTLGGFLFALSVVGIFLNRKNLIVLLMAIELMLLAVNMNFVAFSHYLGDMAGQVFVFFILTVAAAESAIGLAILVVLFRNRSTIAWTSSTRSRADARSPEEHDCTTFPEPASDRAPGAAGRLHPGGSVRQDHRSARCPPGDHPRRADRLHLLGHGPQGRGGGRRAFNATVYEWMTVGSLKMEVGFLIDGLTAMMMCVVTFVSLMVHIYTIGYMEEDRLPALLLLHLAVHLLDADAGDEQQLPAAVLRLGSGGPGVLPADRLLVQEAHGHLRQHEGLPGQPRG